MRKGIEIVLILVAIMLSACGNNSAKDIVNNEIQASDTGTAKMVFAEYEHNFGRVSEGEKVSYVFRFENEGTGRLIIARATTSCGCTIPKYETKPIPPGKGGTLEVVFNTSGYRGVQTKTVQVMSNALIPLVILRITAEVVTDNNE